MPEIVLNAFHKLSHLIHTTNLEGNIIIEDTIMVVPIWQIREERNKRLSKIHKNTHAAEKSLESVFQSQAIYSQNPNFRTL